MLVTRLWRTRTTAQKLCAIQCVCLGYYHRLRDHVPVKKLHEHTTKLCFIAVKICEKAHLLEINQALSSCLLYQHGINFFGFQEFQRETRAPCSHGWQHVPVLLRSFGLLLDPPKKLVIQVYAFKNCGIGNHTIKQQNFD